MAKIIPALSSCLHRMQAGEKRFARCLEALLEEDYTCWYEIPVGFRPRYSDFIILHPSRGLLLLEVKDWKLDTIRRMDAKTAEIITPNGPKIVGNPLEQVRQCTYSLTAKLESDPELVARTGKSKGRLLVPYAYGVVLANITRKQFNGTDLAEVLPSNLVICKDEMTQSIDPESFQKRLWDMFRFQPSRPLTLPQINRIRWHLFPEIRIDPQQGLFVDEQEEEEKPDLVKVLDMNQEQLARSLGDGHRVIHGVAGSGKTLILAFRCEYLAQAVSRPILVLCYNITLAARLRSMVEKKGLAAKVNVYHFHDWCIEHMRNYHVDPPQAHGEEYLRELVQRMIAAVEQGHIPRGQYDAVMVDEGHDFEPEWLRLAVQMVNPETNNFLLLYDDAQSIYGKKGLKFSLSSVGIQARGRTTIMRLNYRNTDEIAHCAYAFASKYLDSRSTDEDHIPRVELQSAGRHGVEPALKLYSGYQEEAYKIARFVSAMHQRKELAWKDMCITCYRRWMGKELENALERLGIPHESLLSAQDKRQFNPDQDSVKIITMHSSKGLEFPCVVVSGIGAMPDERLDMEDEAKLLYVAMTRASEYLMLTAHAESPFYLQLKEMIDKGCGSDA